MSVCSSHGAGVRRNGLIPVYDPLAHRNHEQCHLKSIILNYDLGNVFNYMPGGFDVDSFSFATLQCHSVSLRWNKANQHLSYRLPSSAVHFGAIEISVTWPATQQHVLLPLKQLWRLI
jgi:hypothetical protein